MSAHDFYSGRIVLARKSAYDLAARIDALCADIRAERADDWQSEMDAILQEMEGLSKAECEAARDASDEASLSYIGNGSKAEIIRAVQSHILKVAWRARQSSGGPIG